MNDDDSTLLEPVSDSAWLQRFIVTRWGEPGVVSRGRLWTGEALTAIRAVDGGETVGVASWAAEDDAWQLVTLDSLFPGRGIGTRLVEAVVELARRLGIRRIWLVTTNDNLEALRFHQRRGFRIVAVHPGAIEGSRRIKPSIPEVGAFGIPIRDEIELEHPL
jgi:GNAT superfamily N-acetyltransferase